MKKAAFFDIDGTLYRDSLMLAHMDELVANEYIPPSVYVKRVKPLVDARHNREIEYDHYLNGLIEVYNEHLQKLPVEVIDRCADDAIEKVAKYVYHFTKRAIEYHKSKGHMVIFISGSPDFMVERMGLHYDVDLALGSVYITLKGMYTGEIVPLWDSKSKDKMVDRLVKNHDIDLAKSYAYGDTHGDLIMLNKVGHPTAINPSAELLDAIKADKELLNKISVIVERKDVIYPVGKTTLKNTSLTE